MVSATRAVRAFILAAVVAMCASTVARVAAGEVAARRHVHMRVLVLSAADEGDAQTLAVTNCLRAMGQPYTVVNVLTAFPRPTDTLNLVDKDDADTGLYSLVVLTTRQLSHEASPGYWTPSLSPQQRDELLSYRARFNVRAVSLHSWPHFDGVTPAAGVASIGDEQSKVPAQYELARFVDASLLDPAAVPELEVPMTGSWSTPASVDAAAGFEPVAMFYDSRKGASAEPHGVAAAIQSLYEVETWHFFYTPSNWYAPHVVSLQAALHWGMRGLYVGQRRVLFSVQVDDVFLNTAEWIEAPEVHGDSYRMSGADLQAFEAFQTRVQADMPTGSVFRAEMAFNGDGVDKFGGVSNDLVQKSVELVDSFYWVSHTFDHKSLDPMSTEECAEEANRNVLTASNVWGAPLPAAFDKDSMVTPAITGLSNGDCLSGLDQAGIKYVVGDNSRPELVPATSPHHGMTSEVTTNGAFNDIFVVPRYPTNIYFDNVHPELNAKHFAAIHEDLDHEWSFAEVLAYEAQVTSRNLLHLRHDPYMFHQANIVRYQSGSDDSLLALWVQAVVDEYKRYSRLPMLSLQMDAIAATFIDRQKRDDAMPYTSAVLELSNGVATGIELSCKGPSCADVLVTGVTASAASAAPAVAASDDYGGAVTARVPLTNGAPAAFVSTGRNAPLDNEVCPGGCSGHGSCTTPPKCTCASGYTGDACEFFEIKWGSNLVRNPSFEFSDDDGTVSAWFPFRSGFRTSATTRLHGTRSMVATSRDTKGAGGAVIYVTVEQDEARPLQVQAWSKAEGVVAGGAAAEYALYADVVYMDGAMQFGLTGAFDPSLAEWQQASVVFHPVRPVRAVWVYLLFQHHAGSAYFDQVSVRQASDVDGGGSDGGSGGGDNGNGNGGGDGDDRPVSTDGRCGAASFFNAKCPAGQCCSANGWCGDESGQGSKFCTPSDTACVACAAGSSGPCRMHGSAECVAYSIPAEHVCPMMSEPCTPWSHLHRVAVGINIRGFDEVAFETQLQTRLVAALEKLLPTAPTTVKITSVTNVNLVADNGAVSGGSASRRLLRGGGRDLAASGVSATSSGRGLELDEVVGGGGSPQGDRPAGLSDYTNVGVHVGVVVVVDSAAAAAALALRFEAIISDGSLAVELGVGGITLDNAVGDGDGTSIPAPQETAQQNDSALDDGGASATWVYVMVGVLAVVIGVAVGAFVWHRRASQGMVTSMDASASSLGRFQTLATTRRYKAHRVGGWSTASGSEAEASGLDDASDGDAAPRRIGTHAGAVSASPASDSDARPAAHSERTVSRCNSERSSVVSHPFSVQGASDASDDDDERSGSDSDGEQDAKSPGSNSGPSGGAAAFAMTSARSAGPSTDGVLSREARGSLLSALRDDVVDVPSRHMGVRRVRSEMHNRAPAADRSRGAQGGKRPGTVGANATRSGMAISSPSTRSVGGANTASALAAARQESGSGAVEDQMLLINGSMGLFGNSDHSVTPIAPVRFNTNVAPRS